MEEKEQRRTCTVWILDIKLETEVNVYDIYVIQCILLYVNTWRWK